MTQDHQLAPRVIVAVVNVGRGSVDEDVAKIASDELQAARFTLVRGVTVNREKPFVQQLVSNIANSNEADAIVLIGGVGVGPRDYTCEAVDAVVDQHIEGFGEAYRRLLREELNAGASAFLQRATAGVFNRSLVFALPRQPAPVRLAMRMLVIPTLVDALRVIAGQRPLQRP
jgi:molybdenum cofactor synthesis domain-containing protein